jgi:hypothetical protein
MVETALTEGRHCRYSWNYIIWRGVDGGTVFSIWRPEVPRIPEPFFEYAFYLYKTRSDAEASVKVGATGFIVAVAIGHPVEWPSGGTIGPAYHTYAVTNRHNIDAGGKVIRLNDRFGSVDIIEPEEWVCDEEHDLAACRINLSLYKHKYRFITDDEFVTKEDVTPPPNPPDRTLSNRNHPANVKVGVGDEVYMIGRMESHEGEGVVTNVPVVRFGNIASPPYEELYFARGGGINENTLLVEMRSLNGFSGSPVFWYQPAIPGSMGMSPDAELFERQVGEVKLLGVDFCHISMWESVYERSGEGLLVPTAERVRNNPGMAGVIPAWHLRTFLDRKEFKEMRDADGQVFEENKRRLGTVHEGDVTMDFADSEAGAFSKSDFEKALKRVSRPIQPSEPDKETS